MTFLKRKKKSFALSILGTSDIPHLCFFFNSSHGMMQSDVTMYHKESQKRNIWKKKKMAISFKTRPLELWCQEPVGDLQHLNALPKHGHQHVQVSMRINIPAAPVQGIKALDIRHVTAGGPEPFQTPTSVLFVLSFQDSPKDEPLVQRHAHGQVPLQQGNT